MASALRSASRIIARKARASVSVIGAQMIGFKVVFQPVLWRHQHRPDPGSIELHQIRQEIAGNLVRCSFLGDEPASKYLGGAIPFDVNDVCVFSTMKF